MNKFDHIKKQIEGLNPDFSTEQVSLKDAFNRILQEDVYADTDMPPFDKSAMDGYACREADIHNELELLEIINAGSVPQKEIGRNQCSKIMTGAKVPKGADLVFKVEDSEATDGNRIKCTNPGSVKNICYQGEDYSSGTILIPKGTIINVSHMAVLAGAGYNQVMVSKMPGVALINTGSELVEPSEMPQEGKIRNSNGSQLVSQLKQMKLSVTDLGIIEDDYEKLTNTFKGAFEKNDIVFFTGGASVGDFDWIPKILKDQGFQIYWDRTGIKPGNPMTFSQKGNKYCFGLSGNPVSSLVQFELLAKPALYKLLGAKYKPLRMQVKLNFTIQRKKADRIGIVPVLINEEGLVDQIPFNGSAHINALVFANALMEFPAGEFNLKKGESVYVRPL